MAEQNNNPRKITVLLPTGLVLLRMKLVQVSHWFSRNQEKIRLVVVYLILTILTISAVFLVFVFVDLLDKYEALQEQRASIEEEFTYWETARNKHPNSPDLNFEAAVFAYRLGDNEKAYKYVREALLLDPNFVKAAELAKRIEEN